MFERINRCVGHGRLSRAEHLVGTQTTIGFHLGNDGDRRLDHQVGIHHSEEVVKPVLLVRQRIRKGRTDGTRTLPEHEVDVCDLTPDEDFRVRMQTDEAFAAHDTVVVGTGEAFRDLEQIPVQRGQREVLRRLETEQVADDLVDLGVEFRLRGQRGIRHESTPD